MRSYLLSALSAFVGIVIGAALIGPDRATAAEEAKPTRLGHIVAERLDIVEPDGTLRQVLYSKARDPGVVVKGRQYRHPNRPQSGMLFYNDEGTEVGGLVYAGERAADGTATSGGALSFDAYEQDQLVQLVGVKEGDTHYAGMFVNDRPATPIDFAAMDRLARETDPAKRKSLIAAASSTDPGAPRGFFGRARNGDSTVDLRDADGNVRLRMNVTAAGQAQIAFLDASGKTVRTIAAPE